MPMMDSPYAYQNIVERRCPHCGGYTTIVMTNDEYKNYLKWIDREGLIQDLLPNLSPSDREALISGICDKCWKEMFGQPDDEDDEEEEDSESEEDEESDEDSEEEDEDEEDEEPDVDIYALAREIIEHNITEHCDDDEITKWIEERDSFIWDKLASHGHSEIFDDQDECDNYCNRHFSELFDALNGVWEDEYDKTGVSSFNS